MGKDPGGDHPLVLESQAAGGGLAEIGGSGFEVRWGTDELSGMEFTLEMSPESLEFPLLLRGWEEGDRIRLAYGSKKLKKLFAEARVPGSQRSRVPVLVDARGRVLWVAGVASSILITARDDSVAFFLGIRNVDQP
jgi:tRNA(Ile)-lysidine synthetase-like protein